MRNRIRVTAAAVAVTAALAGSTAAALATTGGKPGPSPGTTASASPKPTPSAVNPTDAKARAKAAHAQSAGHQGFDAFIAAVASELHVSTAKANATLRPLLTAPTFDPSSPAFAATARSLGVSTRRLSAVLAQAKHSLAGGR